VIFSSETGRFIADFDICKKPLGKG